MWYDDIARQRGPLGPETFIWACLTSSKHEICQSSIKCIWPFIHPIFLIWIFWMAPLQSMEADWQHLISQKTRAQTNWSIQIYWWRTISKSYIVSPWYCLQSSLTHYIFLCLYSIALWSQFFEPCGVMTLRVSADPWAQKGPFGLV